MERLFPVATPECPLRPGRKVGKDCKQCDNYRGGIVPNFVDCERPGPKAARKTAKSAREALPKAQNPRKTASKSVKKKK